MLVFVRKGLWLVRKTGSRTEPSARPRPWLLYDPSTKQTRSAPWIPQTTEYEVPKEIQVGKVPMTRSWPARAIALARDGLILYVGSDQVLHLMDPEDGRVFTPALRGPDPQPLSGGKANWIHIRHRGRSPAGQDIFSVGNSEGLRRCFLYDPEAQELVLAPAFEGTLVCVGKKGLYVTEGNQLLRYHFGSAQHELLFPTPEFHENIELGSQTQH